MDLTEAGLELLINQLKQLVESRISSLSLDEISTLSKNFPVFSSLHDFREIRDKFLDKFNNPCKIPQAHSYSERLLLHSTDDCDLSKDTVKSFQTFYQNEIDRACRLRETVLTRCLLPEFNSRIQMQYAKFEDSITRYLFHCREGLLRIQSKDNPTFTINDVLTELSSKFIQKRRKAVLRSLMLHIKRFPLTQYDKILTNMFQLTQKSIKEDQQTQIVPTLPTNEKSIDEKLYFLAQRLNMKPDLQSADGQQFLYFSNKKFLELFNQLTFYDLPRKKVEFPLYFVTPDIYSNKNKIDSSDIQDNFNKADTNAVTSSKNNPQSYKIDISSNAAQKSKEQSYYNSSNSDTSNGAHAINDNYMTEIVKKSQEKTKPDWVEMDDVSWGLLVEMGEQIGLTDTEKLAKLTIKDIEAYFYTKNIIERGKNLLKDNLTANEYVEYKDKKFDSKSYWDNVFDENGNKKDYSIYTLNQSNTGLSLSYAEFFSDKGNMKLKDLSAASIHNILIANENKDTALFTYAVDNAAIAGSKKTIYENQKEMIDYYNTMQEYAAGVPSLYEQTQIMINVLKSSSLMHHII